MTNTFGNAQCAAVPNAHRRLLAEIFSDAEAKGLGSWSPTFQAAPGKTEQACAFIDSRAALLTWKRLLPEPTVPDLGDIEDEDLNPLATTIRAIFAEVLAAGTIVSDDDLGRGAWDRLDSHQQQTTLGAFLASYAGRIIDAERERAREAIARADIHTYLEPGDSERAWSAYVDSEGHDGTDIARDVLGRLMAELELLRHRTTPPEPVA